MTAFVQLVEINQLGICAYCPAFRSCINFIRENTYGNRDGNIPRVEETALCSQSAFPIEAGGRETRIGKPVQGNIVENIIPGKTFLLPVENPDDEFIACNIMIQHPGCEPDG